MVPLTLKDICNASSEYQTSYPEAVAVFRSIYKPMLVNQSNSSDESLQCALRLLYQHPEIMKLKNCGISLAALQTLTEEHFVQNPKDVQIALNSVLDFLPHSLHYQESAHLLLCVIRRPSPICGGQRVVSVDQDNTWLYFEAKKADQ